MLGKVYGFKTGTPCPGVSLGCARPPEVPGQGVPLKGTAEEWRKRLPIIWHGMEKLR